MITAAILCLLAGVVLSALFPPPRYLSPSLFIMIAIILIVVRFAP